MKLFGRAAIAAAVMVLGACAEKPTVPPQIATPAATSPTLPPPAPQTTSPFAAARNAFETGVKLDRPRVIANDQAARALAAFQKSCAAVTTRNDMSGLTVPADWRPLCAQAAQLAPSDAAGFFYYGFDWLKVGDGKAFATGYYEPEIEGSRTPRPGYVPIYRMPPDLVRCIRPDGTSGRGRIDETGKCTSYFSRPEIDDGALTNKGLELAWAKDPVELFFLEIQGSGRIRFDDGSVMRVGYAGQNGRDYVAIGRILRERGILPQGGATMQAIKQWIRSNPDEGRQLMRQNLSFVFFKELTGAGPLGALHVPVTPHASVAADANFVPLGAPVYLANADRQQVDGLWVAQDTGGAIKGANRFDTFWGAGADAVATAGALATNAEALILVPKGVGARAAAQP